MPPASNLLHPLREGPTSSTGLLKALQLPGATVARALDHLQREGEVVRVGATRSTRYALPRLVPEAGSSWPVFRIDTAGRVSQFGRLDALQPRHFHFETSRVALRGISEGLPWFLDPLREPDASDTPAGDARLAWMLRHGWDCAGDLIVGAQALDAWRTNGPRRTLVTAADRAALYPRLAATTQQTQPAARGSFDVLADHGGHQVHARVKFSPPESTTEGQHCCDLLLAEHLAHGYLNARGVLAMHSRVYRYGGRIFLEIDRFDRVGAEGRRGVIALQALGLHRATDRFGASTAAAHLAAAGRLPRNDARQIRLLEAFAAFTAGHGAAAAGLTLFTGHDGSFALAPAGSPYPRVPTAMDDPARPLLFYAPSPEPVVLDVWAQARRLAEGYWERLATEPQLSPAFRAGCAAALSALRGAG